MTGTLKALSLGMNPCSAVLLGVTTAVGGGLLRDVTANEVPQLFNNGDLYAVPAFTGAALTTLLWLGGLFNGLTAFGVAALVFAFRVVAWRRAWPCRWRSTGGTGGSPDGGKPGTRN